MTANLPIVGIGASAGGVEALEALFRAMPNDNGMAFVVVTHLDPNRESMLAEIIGRATGMPVATARDGEPVARQHVYVLPAGAVLTIRDGRLRLRRINSADRERTPIDLFFGSLAEDQAERAIGIVLSGGGSDGTLGLKAIKENGGLTIAQGANTSRPRFSEMPTNAVAAGFVDLVLSVERIPVRLLAYVNNWGAFDPARPADALSKIYPLLRTRIGHDFSQYKDNTFLRRVQRRMQVVQIAKLDEYVELLEKDSDEVAALFRDLLIGVTAFFRDLDPFGALKTTVIPKLLEGKNSDDEVRVWVPGCATGEEAYSIAILLREQMDRLHGAPKVQIFATDIDDAAMAFARKSRYPANLVNEIPPGQLKRFFIVESESYQMLKEVRDLCIFSNHSLIRDPPFSRLDLISCRNLLIYLKPELQKRIIPLFHYALRPGGYLFLGPSENISSFTDLFQPIDRRNRIYQRRDLDDRPSLPLDQFLPYGRQWASATAANRSSLSRRSDLLRKVSNTILEHFAPVHVLVDEDGQVMSFSGGTGKYLQVAAGPPTRDLLAMARPGLRADLRTALHQAKQTGRRATRDRVAVQIDGGIQMIGLAVEPIREGDETVYGAVFIDAGPIRATAENGGADHSAGEDAAVQQLETELEETKERLQSTIEELETANEEFRSSNEELLSVNEELQSSNEELETSKEELQSVNEELQTVNAELSHKVEEIDRANSDLHHLFQSTEIPTIFLDRNLVIRTFTPPVGKIFNLIPGDRGRPLTDIVSRIDYPDLQSDIRTVFESAEMIERAVGLTGRKDQFLARVLPYRGAAGEIDGVVVTFVDVTSIIAAEEEQKALAAELSHRVKNSLAVVSSIAERTLEQSASKDDFVGRLHALAQTHDLLSRTGWTEASLREVILAELAPHPVGSGRNVTVSGPQVLLKPRGALFLAMVFHELATNAAKYGALSVPGGRIDATWGVNHEQPPQLELIWAEQGGPRIENLPRRGFGVDLIERGVPFDLGGEAKLEVIDGALHCKIGMPASADLLTLGAASSPPSND